MKRILKKLEAVFADAALLEERPADIVRRMDREVTRETIEENLVEVAFAEAADYDDIHQAILREHREDRAITRPDDCGQGDNDLCFV